MICDETRFMGTENFGARRPPWGGEQSDAGLITACFNGKNRRSDPPEPSGTRNASTIFVAVPGRDMPAPGL